MSSNVFDYYEKALALLLIDLENKSGKQSLSYEAALNFQTQLHENTQGAMDFGDTRDAQSRRNQILNELNKLTIRELNKSFNEYYLPVIISSKKIDDRKKFPIKDIIANPQIVDERILGIAQICYDRGFTLEVIKRLIDILGEAIMEHEKRSPINRGMKENEAVEFDSSGEMFFHISRTLGFCLAQLEACHLRWSDLTIADPVTEQSLDLLQEIEDHVLVTKPFVEQTYKDDWVDIESQAMVLALGDLRQSLIRIDPSLMKGDVIFAASDDIEEHFSDITYYVARYLLLLDELSSQKRKDAPIQ